MKEEEQILEHINAGNNFLLSGGAGSGKTYSLVEVIRAVIRDKPSSKIACMTYTNAAVKEIETRVNHPNLNVTTIHDFLWDQIKNFNNELKACLVDLANDKDVKAIKVNSEEPITIEFFAEVDEIEYQEYTRIKEGKISHDEVIVLSEKMFEKYPKLVGMVKDKFPYIFIDEYQDTQKEVVRIFLEHFNVGDKKSVIGFFGDSMQSIYDDGVGDLDAYVADGSVKEVKKEQNRRNPDLIIQLANKLRTDRLEQRQSDDLDAPNMDNGTLKQGEITFLHSKVADLNAVKFQLDWDFSDSKNTKELNLTHNLIAGKAGFRTLMDIYDKEPVLGLMIDILSSNKENKKYGKPELPIGEDDSFDEVVERFQLRNRKRQLKKDVLLEDPTTKQLYDKIKHENFSDIRKMYLNKDQLIDDKKQDEDEERKKGSKRDDLIKHLHKLQTNIWLYSNGYYNEFLRLTDFRKSLTSVAQKQVLQDKVRNLIEVGEKTIGKVIEEAHESGICEKSDQLERFKREKRYVYDRVIDVPFKEFQCLFEYLEGRTPFSTQHKVKGTQFDNVLVVLDNGNWNDYNFNYLLAPESSEQELVNLKSKGKKKLESFPKILHRSQKIFYVCCTRAKERLAVYYHDPSPQVLSKAKEWFGEENVKPID